MSLLILGGGGCHTLVHCDTEHLVQHFDEYLNEIFLIKKTKKPPSPSLYILNTVFWGAR